MRTNFNETQLKRIMKMAIEKGITLGRQGEGKGWFGKKTDSEVALAHLDDLVKDIDDLFHERSSS